MKNRESIKNGLEGLIKEYHLEQKLSVDSIISWIAKENEPNVMKANRDYQEKWLKYFIHEEDIDNPNKVLLTFTDAWNYFPHKSLGGLSSAEKAKK